ncbi:hypothetical protein [Streptomyces sp. NPDC055287]
MTRASLICRAILVLVQFDRVRVVQRPQPLARSAGREVELDAAHETPGAWPPYTELSGVRVYFIHVRVLPPTTTASKAGKATRVTLTHDELTNPDTT